MKTQGPAGGTGKVGGWAAEGGAGVEVAAGGEAEALVAAGAAAAVEEVEGEGGAAGEPSLKRKYLHDVYNFQIPITQF